MAQCAEFITGRAFEPIRANRRQSYASRRHRDSVAVVRQILAVALLVTGLGLILEFIVPASARMIDIGALVFGVATWIVPPLLLTLSNTKRSSLQSVGFTIYLFVVAMLRSFARAAHPVFRATCRLGLARSPDHCGILDFSGSHARDR
jgi:hypothetical protein